MSQVTRESALQALRSWISAQTSIPLDRMTIAREGEATAAHRPAADISGLTWGVTAGEDDHVHWWDDEQEELVVGIIGDRTGTLQVTIRSAVDAATGLLVLDPYEVLEVLAQSLEKVTVRDTLRAAGLAVRAASAPRYLASIQPTEWEPAAACDFLVSYTRRTTDAPGWIDRVRAELDLDGVTTVVEEPPEEPDPEPDPDPDPEEP